jgi:hypothetical protein
MQEPEQPPSHHEGEALVEEFRWVHGLVRNELEAVRALADRVLGGADGDEIRTEIESLAVNSPIWALRVNCLHYCRFVHGHHTLEDVAFFPRLRRADPALDPVVDRLEREHRVIAEHLDAIESHAASLAEPGARPSLVEALDDLAGHLLEHLDYEEESIFPTLRGMADWRR